MTEEKSIVESRYNYPDAGWRGLFVTVTALVLILFGALYLVFPVELAGAINTTLNDAGSVVEYRAYYGGLQLGLGVFLLLAGARHVDVQVLLLLVLTCFGSVLVVRTIAVVVNLALPPSQAVPGFHLVALGLELIVVVVAWSALRK